MISFELPSLPSDWTYKDVLDFNVRYVSLDETYERLQFIEHKDGVDVFRDTEKDDNVYIGRPFGAGDELRMSYDFLAKGFERVKPYLPLIQENLTRKTTNPKKAEGT